jgi:acetyl-CoA synthetase
MSDERQPLPGPAAVANLADYPAVYQAALADPDAFWLAQAAGLDWFRPPTVALKRGESPFFTWFEDGQTNVALNALDRHAAPGSARRNQLALIWEGEPMPDGAAETRQFTYSQLSREVSRFANVLKSLGISRGDRVAIYMGRVPEQAIAMLACAKIGAVHTVVYGGLSVEALRSRVADAEARLIITADGGWLNGKVVPLKAIVDDAAAQTPSVERVIVVKRAANDVGWVDGRDAWWHDIVTPEVSAVCATEPMNAEDPFFIIYTSGSTGAPKGVLHTVGGYCVDVYAALKWVLDFKPGDTLFCTSDAGWIVGHSIVLYGPLMHGVTTIMYEGAPAFPNPGRWWSIVERHGATILYTAPTGVRGLMRFGDEWPKKHDLSGLRLLSCAGEPLNPEAWRWFDQTIGGGRCPVIDSWWQTELPRPMISALISMPGKPGSCCRPMPGVSITVVDDAGHPVPADTEGALLITSITPGMLRTVYRDPDRYTQQYWSRYPGAYLTGDSAKFDGDGYLWVIGRVDDVIKVSGYRLGTAEVESALVSHPAVAEAAVIGLPHEVRGNAIHAYVILRQGAAVTDDLPEQLRAHVGKVMGPIAKPERVTIVSALPKTRSGKIMRRVLKARALGQPEGDVSTME